MNEILEKKLELFVTNRKTIRGKFIFDEPLMNVAAALIFTSADSEADMEKMAECKKILNKEAFAFPKLKKTVKLALLSKMTLAEDPEAYVTDVKGVYDKIKKGFSSDNLYTALAAMLICDIGIQDDCDEVISKAAEIMKRMKKDHPFITTKADTSFVMLLALSYKDVDTIINELGEAYEYLNNSYKISVTADALQGLCEMLTLSYGDVKAKCDKAMKIYNAFAERKLDKSSDMIFSAIGALIDIDQSPISLTDEILEADAFLKTQDGFKDGSMEKNHRAMYAAFIVAESYGKGSEISGNPFISNTLSIIEAQKMVKLISFLINAAPSVVGALIDSGDTSSASSAAEAVSAAVEAVSANAAEKKEG